jgi:hypothetical protein
VERSAVRDRVKIKLYQEKTIVRIRVKNVELA